MEHIGAIPICLRGFGSFSAMTQEGSSSIGAHWTDFGRSSLVFRNSIEEAFHSTSHFRFCAVFMANFILACCFPDWHSKA
jgi:hypothetical protein